jgi:hypothetical protein
MKKPMEPADESTLKRTLQQLPEYHPPDELWLRIQSVRSFAQAIQNLPAYEPSDSAWNSIRGRLHKQQQVRLLRPLAAIAASAALLILFLQPWARSGTSYQYHTEAVDAQIWSFQLSKDEGDFELANAWCAQHPFLCARPDIAQVKSELEQLTAASESLRKALGAYGTDEHLIRQLNRIEMDRTRLLKQFFEYLIS